MKIFVKCVKRINVNTSKHLIIELHMFLICALKEYLNLCKDQPVCTGEICSSYIIYYLHVSVTFMTIIRVPSQEY
jgi:hypothetical protein